MPTSQPPAKRKKPVFSLTSENLQRYVRIGLQWLAGYLVTAGMIQPNATWVQPAIGLAVGFASLIWTAYGNRLAAKINEIAKADVVNTVVLNNKTVAESIPAENVVSIKDVKVTDKP